ncbi:hypothetical protein V2I01_41100 [Micromonospora sp. BRA006-A]|nr:hypothetical protein [Micromonospora sp. BRA006-A]
MTVPDLRHAMRSYLRAEDDLEAEAEVLRERGWLTRDADGGLRIAQAGRTRGSGSSSTRRRSEPASTRASTTPITSPPSRCSGG